MIAPALRFVRARLDRGDAGVPKSYELAVRIMLRQVELLWRRGMLDYILLRGSKPTRTGEAPD